MGVTLLYKNGTMADKELREVLEGLTVVQT